jgi:hypothetical protein
VTPAAFIAKWRPAELNERAAAQTHFNDLCRMLGLDDPVAADPRGDWFAFERGAGKTSGGDGWADVWRKGCFGWEYKRRHKDLDAAYRQLLNYAVALENPPLLITCDTDRIVIRTNFTNTVQETHTLALDDLLDGSKRDLLRHAFTDPERLRPKKTRDALTAEAASRFSTLALRLRERGHVKPMRAAVRRDNHRLKWWIHGEARPGMRRALAPLARFAATPRVAKHRLFVWFDLAVLPDCQLVVIARDDDTTFGILHSRFHELWSLRMGTSLEDRPRYTPSTTFETFPFPEGLTPDIPAAGYAADPRAQVIAAAAAELDARREAWLNPSDLVTRVPEVVPGYPDRLLPKDEAAAAVLRKRTLTNLYNQRPAWLDQAHRRLDEAVAEAYGWGEDWRGGRLGDEAILARLFALNRARAG